MKNIQPIKKKQTKSTAYTVAHRVNTVATLLCNFYTRRQIIEYVREETDWKVSAVQIDKYIRAAKNQIKEAPERSEIFDIVTKNLQQLYLKNMLHEDFRECRAILGDIVRLYGLNAPEEKNLSLSGQIPISQWIEAQRKAKEKL